MASLATFPRSRRTGFIHKGTRFCTSEFALPDDVRGETNGDVSLVEAIGADASRDRMRAAVEMEGVALEPDPKVCSAGSLRVIDRLRDGSEALIRNVDASA